GCHKGLVDRDVDGLEVAEEERDKRRVAADRERLDRVVVQRLLCGAVLVHNRSSTGRNVVADDASQIGLPVVQRSEATNAVDDGRTIGRHCGRGSATRGELAVARVTDARDRAGREMREVYLVGLRAEIWRVREEHGDLAVATDRSVEDLVAVRAFA